MYLLHQQQVNYQPMPYQQHLLFASPFSCSTIDGHFFSSKWHRYLVKWQLTCPCEVYPIHILCLEQKFQDYLTMSQDSDQFSVESALRPFLFHEPELFSCDFYRPENSLRRVVVPYCLLHVPRFMLGIACARKPLSPIPRIRRVKSNNVSVRQTISLYRLNHQKQFFAQQFRDH